MKKEILSDRRKFILNMARGVGYASIGGFLWSAYLDDAKAAPLMIPHSTEGLLPITQNNNACLGCHMPAVAKSMGATPIPVSHFTNFRPNTVVKGNELLKNGQVVKNTSSESLSNVSIKVNKKENKLYAGRYNCSQCHAPQTTSKLVDKNKFKPVYTAPNGSSKSSWNQSQWLKDINTQKTSK